jgi:hypothetical protein
MSKKKSPEEKKISTIVYLTREQDIALRLLNQRTRVPIAVYIRDGIDLVIKNNQILLPEILNAELAHQRIQDSDSP